MIEIDNTLVSTEIFDNQFTCNLSACKGACCVHGDSGAPVEDDEIEVMESIVDDVLPYLSPEGRASIEANGAFVIDDWNETTTPLINGKECAYTVFTDNGTALCGIEKAYRDGKVAFKKPISCELYPIRLKSVGDHIALNYHRWHICEPAVACGKKEGLPAFRFLKDAITRKFGDVYYTQLEEAYKLWLDYSKK